MDLGSFRLALFRFSYRAEETVRMTGYKGNILRGGFGAALKRVSCNVKRASCDECMLKANCAYSQIFETPIPKDSKYFEGQTFAPHPFVLEPSMNNVIEYKSGDQIDFHLVLIGKAIEFLPYFVIAFHILGEWGLGERVGRYRGSCFLEKIESFDDSGKHRIVYIGESQQLSDEYSIITSEDILDTADKIDQNIITLEFLTPTRIKSRGRLRDSIDFEMLIRSLLRRILALSYFHCDQELELDYKTLVQEATQKVQKVHEESQWNEWSRYSRRQNARMSLGGFKGKITFEGDLGTFIPFLLLGQYIHVGKGTAFGLGKYAIRD